MYPGDDFLMDKLFTLHFFLYVICYILQFMVLFQQQLRLKLQLLQSSLKQKQNYSEHGSKCWVMMFQRERKLYVLMIRMPGVNELTYKKA